MRSRLRKAIMIVSFLPFLFFFTNCSNGGFDVASIEQPSTSAGGVTPTPSPSPSPSPSPTVSPSPSPSPTVSPSPSPSPSPTVPPVTSGKVSAMLAVGHQARTTLSCDGGKSWINDRSDNASVRCYEGGVDCDHTPVSAMGQAATFANGYFYTQYGWGYNGTIRRSTDGVNWQTVRTGDWAGGIGSGGNRVFSLWADWTYSNDNGMTWTKSTKSFTEWDMEHPLISQTASKLFAVGRVDRPLQMAMSSDGGMSWTTVPSFQTAWGASFAESSSGLLVSLGTTVGLVARSTDGGKTWTTHQAHSVANATWSSPLLYNGTQFVAFAGSKKYVSADGITWTSTTMVNAPGSGPAAYNPVTKTYSVIQNEWNNYYAKQKAWVSTDAVTWTTLSSTQFKGGHPLIRIILGEVDKSVCP